MKDYSLPQLEEMLMEYANRAYLADKEYEHAKEEYQVLDDNYKITFALLTTEREEKSEAAKERITLISDKWREYVLTYANARKEKGKWFVEQKNCDRMVDVLRTLISSKRKELDRLGG